MHNLLSEIVIDILEDAIAHYGVKLLDALLQDKTTKKNIIWGTSDYKDLGIDYEASNEIKSSLITGLNGHIIQPRVTKAKSEQSSRTRDKAEVFTPSWVCNAQNNLVDNQWFGRKNVFNIEQDNSWCATREKIEFTDVKKTWKKYVDAQRLEISCGEAPYLVSRYDTVSGEPIEIPDRIGLLDRKLRVVNENTETDDEWYEWCIRAFQSVYGYEYQGDNLLLARENLLYTFIEYYRFRLNKEPDLKQLMFIANIISWNLWQMDALTYTVPYSDIAEVHNQFTIFDYLPEYSYEVIEEPKTEPCKIKDWRSNCSVTYKSMIKG